MWELGKIEIKIKEMVGVAKPFPQGGVWRLTIPKKVVKEYDLEFKRKKGKFFAFVFLKTDKGLFLLPLSKVINPQTIRGALMKFVDVSKISDEELQALFEEVDEI